MLCISSITHSFWGAQPPRPPAPRDSILAQPPLTSATCSAIGVIGMLAEENLNNLYAQYTWYFILNLKIN